MNLMREQHFRRKCARHTISVASPLFGECRTEETPSCRTSGAYREHAGLFRRGVCGGWPAFFRVRSLRMETVAALLLIMLGGCKEERPVAEAPTPLGMQRIAVAGRHTSIKTGVGPNLLLLHTLRTQLDIFEKIIPGLEQHFTVHAFDYPGHGWSDIPNAAYAPKDFYQWTAAYLDKLDIRRAAIVGISIGGTLSLMLAARQNPRVARVIAVNPYDYWPAGGIRKSSLAARLVFTPSDVPVLGATIMRLRNRYVSDRIFEGGLA